MTPTEGVSLQSAIRRWRVSKVARARFGPPLERVAAIERGLDLIEQYARSTGLFRREETLFVWRTIQFDNAGDKVVKSPEDNAKACTHVSDGHCRARSRGGFTFQSGERSYFERPRLPAARPLRTGWRHDRSLWNRGLVPSFGLARVGRSFFSIGQVVRSWEPADTLLRRWGLATRLPRRHAPRQDPLCLRRRNLSWRRASTEERRRLSHVLRRSLIVRYVVLQVIGTTNRRLGVFWRLEEPQSSGWVAAL